MSEFFPINPNDKLSHELMPIIVGIGLNSRLLCYGSCFMAWPHLAVTAKHVVDELLKQDPNIAAGLECQFEYWIIQIKWQKDQHDYIVWTIESISTSPHSDIALIWLKPLNSSARRNQSWGIAPVSFDPPAIGETVTAFGLHNVSFNGSEIDSDGKLKHLDLKPDRSLSAGVVQEHYWAGRDRGLYNFPCFQVDSRFESGMSGGPVFNASGIVCGIVCGSLPAIEANEPHVSYVSMLWPMMAIPVSPQLVPGGQASKNYRLKHLSEKGIFTPIGWDRVLIDDQLSIGGPISIQYLRRID